MPANASGGNRGGLDLSLLAMNSAKPTWEAVGAGLYAFIAGLFTAFGIQDLRQQFAHYEWMYNFLMALAMCICATVSVLRVRQAFQNAGGSAAPPLSNSEIKHPQFDGS